MNTDNFKRNNLDRSSSPYLLQHADNPIWWQEWNREVLAHAEKSRKPLLVSIGYSTCHWCHVMAAEAFSDHETAAFLNDNFVSIKVDREQRPDIDQYMMHFIQAQSGSGGWPLNIFLTPGLRPIMALTYAPASSDRSRMSFFDIARRVLSYYQTEGNSILPYSANEPEPPAAEEESLTKQLESYFDDEYGGFGTGQKFPPHSTLLFLLYYMSVRSDTMAEKICTDTLDAMMLRGLNDHLQGGVFRYCVDRQWTIPHFEKMLYDQAMALWCYPLAYKMTGRAHYKTMAEKIVRCLDECFESKGLYASAFNADTDHKEGATYLWSEIEIERILGKEDFKKLCEVYDVTAKGNFDGLNHLVRKNSDSVADLEEKLLTVRKTREQPSRDEKILCGINALTAVSLIQAGRFLDMPWLEEKAAGVVTRLLDMFWDGAALGHSFYNGLVQKQSFLSDASALLLAVTMLYENDTKWGKRMNTMADYVQSFRQGGEWMEARAADFMAVQASWFDHPIPSGVSLAETGLARYALLTGKEIARTDYRRPYQSDFYNIFALMSNDLFHIITSREKILWRNLPANSMQKRGEPETDCYNKVCRPLER